MAAGLQEMQENQRVPEIQIDKLEFVIEFYMRFEIIFHVSFVRKLSSASASKSRNRTHGNASLTVTGLNRLAHVWCC